MSDRRRPDRESNRDRRAVTLQEVYDAAKMLCERGWSANKIARELYPEVYARNKAGQSWAIVRVGLLIARAQKTGIISFRYEVGDLGARLSRHFNNVRFTVVDDAVAGGEPVFQEAARQLAQRIDDLMRREADDAPVVIANAGGLAVNRVTEYLATIAPHYPNAADRLLFISLNALRRTSSYHLSANYVAVRMAQIFGGRHLAMLNAPSAVAEYEKACETIHLLVCGAGSRAGFLPEWLHDKDSPSQASDLPTTVVGDLCLIPLDADGHQVRLGRAAERLIRDELSPRPSYEKLQQLAAEDKVLVVLAVPDVGRLAEGISLKIPITQALLKPPLTRWCVLGSSLAKALHQSTIVKPEVKATLEAQSPLRTQRRAPRLPGAS
jgi:hypothetical protein